MGWPATAVDFLAVAAGPPVPLARSYPLSAD